MVAKEKSVWDRINEYWDGSRLEAAPAYNVADEVGKDQTSEHYLWRAANPAAVTSKLKHVEVKHSRIRVQLSRPLRVAEIEKLTTDHNVIAARLNVTRNVDGFLFKLRVSPSGTHVWVDADLPSRDLYEVVATALDQHFVNVYPTAVRTFTEYNGK